MSTFETILKVHVAMAVACAALFWVPVFTSKGGRLHKRAGLLYVFFLFLVTATAIALTAATFQDPAATRPAGGGMPLDPMVGSPELYRAYQLFLGYVAAATFAAALLGLASLKKHDRGRGARAALHGAVLVLGAGVVGMGVRHGEAPMIAVGAAGALLGAIGVRLSRQRGRDAAARLRGHVVGMIASGIGAYSALAVVVGNRVAPEFFHGPFGLSVWLLPAAVGVPAMLLVLRRYAAPHKAPVPQR